MPGPYISKEHLGGFQLYKTAGQTANGPGVGDTIHIGVSDAPSDQPDNNVYPGIADGSAGLMNVIKGGRTPIVMVTAPAHPNWFRFGNINDWIGGMDTYLDANYDTSEYSCRLWEPVTGGEIYDGGHCQSIVISYNAQGGGIMVQMGWPAIYGPGESGSSPTFANYVRQYGQCYNRGDVKVTGFDQDRSWVLTVVRAQGRQFSGSSGGLNAYAQTSHVIGGSFALEQNKTFTSVPSTSCSVQVGPATTGVKFSLRLNRDGKRRSFPGNAPGSQMLQYGLADIANANSGSNAGYPLLISAGT